MSTKVKKILKRTGVGTMSLTVLYFITFIAVNIGNYATSGEVYEGIHNKLGSGGTSILLWDGGSTAEADPTLLNIVASVIISFFLGVTSIIWYPLKKINDFLKTRRLKNKNLELDIQIKENIVDGKNTNSIPPIDDIHTIGLK